MKITQTIPHKIKAKVGVFCEMNAADAKMKVCRSNITTRWWCSMSAGLKYIDHQNLEEMPER